MRDVRTFLALGAMLTTSCGGALPGLPGGVGGGGGGLGAECQQDWGSGDAALKLSAFLGATGDFLGAAADIQDGLENACTDMGRELGLSASDMAASGNTPGVKAACDAVASKLRDELSDLRAQGHLRIAVTATPPVCQVSMDAYAGCAAECEANVDPGQVQVHCEGGELRGGCSGECHGSCSARASGRCSGACEGSCQGGCEGTCNGQCEGTCSVQGANGECAGTCDGTCRGTCSAGCQGSCEGECVVEASARCEGECRGECSVEFTEPTCTGEIRPPNVSAECQASCDAHLDAQAQCTPGQVVVSIDGDISGDIADRVGALKSAIESGLPAIQALAAKLQRLGRAGGRMVNTAEGLGGSVASLGLRAGQCVSQAAAALPRAAAQVTVSVQVSVSVSASVGAG